MPYGSTHFSMTYRSLSVSLVLQLQRIKDFDPTGKGSLTVAQFTIVVGELGRRQKAKTAQEQASRRTPPRSPPTQSLEDAQGVAAATDAVEVLALVEERGEADDRAAAPALGRERSTPARRQQNAAADAGGATAAVPVRIPRSGHVAFGGHSKEWTETPYWQRMGNNKKLRSEREAAVLQKKLLEQETKRILSGKAKKAIMKEKKAERREKKRSESDK